MSSSSKPGGLVKAGPCVVKEGPGLAAFNDAFPAAGVGGVFLFNGPVALE